MLVNKRWYPIHNQTAMQYMVNRDAQTEEMRNPESGFYGVWNASTETNVGVAPGCGIIIHPGRTTAKTINTFLDSPGAVFESQFQSPSYTDWLPLKSSDGRDRKHNTKATAGGQRAFYGKLMRYMLKHPEESKRDKAITLSMKWCRDNLRNRPWSTQPWGYQGNSGEWLNGWGNGRRSDGPEWRGNRVDAAHASRPESANLAFLGVDIGIACAFMEYRSVIADSLNTWQYVLGQPREAWLLNWCRFGHYLDFQNMHEDLTQVFGGLRPRAVIRKYVKTLREDWYDKYPPLGPSKSDNKQAPQSKGVLIEPAPENPREWEFTPSQWSEAGECNGRYPWQLSFLAWNLKQNLMAGLIDSEDREWVEGFGVDICKQSLKGFIPQARAVRGRWGWSGSAGLTEFDDEATAQACLDECLQGRISSGYDPGNWIVRQLDNGKWHMIGSASPTSYGYILADPINYFLGDEHYHNDYAYRMFRPDGDQKTKYHSYMSGLWKKWELTEYEPTQ